MSPFPCNSTVWVQNRSLVSRVIMLDADGHPHVLAIVHTYMVLLATCPGHYPDRYLARHFMSTSRRIPHS